MHLSMGVPELLFNGPTAVVNSLTFWIYKKHIRNILTIWRKTRRSKKIDFFINKRFDDFQHFHYWRITDLWDFLYCRKLFKTTAQFHLQASIEDSCLAMSMHMMMDKIYLVRNKLFPMDIEGNIYLLITWNYWLRNTDQCYLK